MSGKSAERYIDPVTELGGLLLSVEKPDRYSGGEFGILAKKDASFRTLIAFPDLYEIGMGNQALRIIYNNLNNIQDVSCDRAFAPAPDFERLLREKNIPLYGLDTGISLACLDLLMFTLGYELGLNGVLAMLDVSGIPLRCEERNKDGYPIIIAGGPAVSNPLPYSPFIDAFWIGEAEAGFFDLAAELARLKKSGKGRAALLEKISSHPNVWVRGKEKASRAAAAFFPQDAAVFPVPSMKIVQHHGAVEIMRGCPNGCRFCHAGYWYRPMRQKCKELIASQARQMVTKGGWREISMSSLSSGDYCGIGELVEGLNNMFAGLHVSFQMPSLKVSSFSLSLLEKISATRKSGLTFAVETPQEMRQIAINKEVARGSVTAILDEAKKRGWKTAKFYFMIGLPVPEAQLSEEEEIVDFIADVGRKARMHFNINVGIFVPKPHTPYQWASQLDSETAVKKLEFIRFKLKPLGHKVSVSDPLISRIEGLLSRGDERAGLLCEQAYHGGSRLDAWNEYINREKWTQLLEDHSNVTAEFFSGQNNPPWLAIDSRVSREYLHSELEKSKNPQRTPSCLEKCSLCGVCGKDVRITPAGEKNAPPEGFFTGTGEENIAIPEKADFIVNHDEEPVNENAPQRKSDPDVYRLLFAFSKDMSAVFHGHLSLIEIFSMAFTRAGIPVLYTQGFNPLAKIEFASPLTTGISAGFEIAAADFAGEIQADFFIASLNANLPQGVRIEKAEGFRIPSGTKKYSLSSLLWGFSYTGARGETDYVSARDEKKYRQSRLEKDCASLFSLRRGEVLARNKKDNLNEWASYFDTYRFLYS